MTKVITVASTYYMLHNGKDYVCAECEEVVEATKYKSDLQYCMRCRCRVHSACTTGPEGTYWSPYPCQSCAGID